jgi:hypothetical protein
MPIVPTTVCKNPFMRSAGFEIDVTDNFDLNVEGYYKRFTQLIALESQQVRKY